MERLGLRASHQLAAYADNINFYNENMEKWKQKKKKQIGRGVTEHGEQFDLKEHGE